MTQGMSFTHAAMTTLAARGLSMAETKAHILREVLAEFTDEEDGSFLPFFFIEVTLTPTSSRDTEPTWYVTMTGDEKGLVVDLAEVSTSKPANPAFLPGGRFAGMTLRMPRGFSDDEREE